MTAENFIKNHGGQKEVAQHFEVVKKKQKNLTALNPISRQNTLWEHMRNKSHLRPQKTKGFVTSRPAINKSVKKVP